MFKAYSIAVSRHARAGTLLSLVLTAAAPAAAQTVVVTSKPAHSLVALVMGSTGEPRVLVDGSASPHTYQLRPSDAKAVSAATVLVRISEGLEPFSARLVRAMPKGAHLITLSEAPGVELLPRRNDPTFEIGKAARAATHKHDHDHGEHGGVDDPHVWLDPRNAQAMLAHIAAELSRIAPANAGTYARNADAAARRLDTLQEELAATLSPIAAKPFVVFHDSVQYMERRFGLSAAGAIAASPELQPGARRIGEIRARIQKLGSVCVFAEPQFDRKLVVSVTQGTSARAGTLDPEGVELAPGPEFYETLMRRLAANLRACLDPP